MPRGKRSRKNKGEEAGAPLWMVTYSDMITLVLAFFILLFSFSVVDDAKFFEVLSSIRVSFLGNEGILPGAYQPTVTDEDGPYDFNDIDQIYITYHNILKYIEESGMTGSMEVYLEERGIVLVIPDALLFAPADAELKAEAQEILVNVADLLEQVDNQIIVEGHTDNVPINTLLFPSNWELSVGRAVTVTRFLVEAKGVDPLRLVAAGYGEFHPVASNLTSDGRSRNRRVNIVISSLDYPLAGGRDTNESTDQ
ncbi:OmpA family protein [Candidatus Contubernalis alkaliaceticus]|uniref:OmpA family protein n=1 Tax=Candidatus Contubernalis alkaliaceticus TaxID=338645 RepID=UPI001F4BE9C5|nr:OmpA family protein [Candidatus Contubernalis alkalaceticus]UNC91753.1 OmpA family protein [Candidatus Contubernalis alkalaceticus]